MFLTAERVPPANEKHLTPEHQNRKFFLSKKVLDKFNLLC